MKLKVKPENLDNQKIAWILRAIATAYTIKNGSFFKIRAYNNAADEIEHLNIPVIDLWQKNKLVGVTNIGPNIRQHLSDLFQTGQSKHFDQLLRDIHSSVLVFIKIPGIGPKVAYKLSQNFSFPEKGEIKIVEKLIKLADEHKIQRLPGFKEKTEQRLKKLALEFLRLEKEHRYLLSQAIMVADPLVEFIKQIPFVLDVQVLGSLRRRLATIGDIDIAVNSRHPEILFQQLRKYPLFKGYEVAGKNKARMILRNSYRVDVIASPAKNFGSLLQYLTGSKFHNIALRGFSLNKHYSLSEHGIKDLKTGQTYHFSDEKGFYNFLGLDWIPAELRENRGEIKAALKHKLPNLISRDDITGDFHIHSSFDIKTNYDLGQNTILELALKAKAKNYQYIAISDHNPKPSLSLNQKVGLLKQRKKLISQVEKQTGIKIFSSLEVDILTSGELAIESKMLDWLDFIIVAIHTNFNLPIKEMTARVLKGLSYPKVKILAHPTGRLLNKRKGFQLDWQAIFNQLLSRDQALEINSTPERLDVSDEIVYMAVKAGVNLVIDSDAHSAQAMDQLKLGLWDARRGWAETKNIINSRSLAEVKQWLIK